MEEEASIKTSQSIGIEGNEPSSVKSPDLSNDVGTAENEPAPQNEAKTLGNEISFFTTTGGPLKTLPSEEPTKINGNLVNKVSKSRNLNPVSGRPSFSHKTPSVSVFRYKWFPASNYRSFEPCVPLTAKNFQLYLETKHAKNKEMPTYLRTRRKKQLRKKSKMHTKVSKKSAKAGKRPMKTNKKPAKSTKKPAKQIQKPRSLCSGPENSSLARHNSSMLNPVSESDEHLNCSSDQEKTIFEGSAISGTKKQLFFGALSNSTNKVEPNSTGRYSPATPIADTSKTKIEVKSLLDFLSYEEPFYNVQYSSDSLSEQYLDQNLIADEESASLSECSSTIENLPDFEEPAVEIQKSSTLAPVCKKSASSKHCMSAKSCRPALKSKIQRLRIISEMLSLLKHRPSMKNRRRNLGSKARKLPIISERPSSSKDCSSAEKDRPDLKSEIQKPPVLSPGFMWLSLPKVGLSVKNHRPDLEPEIQKSPTISPVKMRPCSPELCQSVKNRRPDLESHLVSHSDQQQTSSNKNLLEISPNSEISETETRSVSAESVEIEAESLLVSHCDQQQTSSNNHLPEVSLTSDIDDTEPRSVSTESVGKEAESPLVSHCNQQQTSSNNHFSEIDQSPDIDDTESCSDSSEGVETETESLLVSPGDQQTSSNIHFAEIDLSSDIDSTESCSDSLEGVETEAESYSVSRGDQQQTPSKNQFPQIDLMSDMDDTRSRSVSPEIVEIIAKSSSVVQPPKKSVIGTPRYDASKTRNRVKHKPKGPKADSNSDDTLKFKSLSDFLSKYKISQNEKYFSVFQALESLNNLSDHTHKTLFFCPLCPAVFDTEIDIKEHLRTHPNKRNFIRLHIDDILKSNKPKLSCSECSSSKCELYFKTRKELDMQSKTHSDDQNFSCSKCGAKFNEKHLIKSDKPQLSRSKCSSSKCELHFKTKKELDMQSKTHSDDQNFSCSKRGAKFNEKHLIKSDKPQFSRSKCSSSKCELHFKTRKELDTQLKTHSDDQNFSCSKCGARFNEKHHLDKHLLVKCARIVRAEDYLNKHSINDSNVLKFPCLKCGAMYSKQHLLNLHLLVNCEGVKMGDYLSKNFIDYPDNRKLCVKCGLTFKTLNKCIEHSKEHFNGEKLSSAQCSKSVEMANESVEQRFACSRCELKFKTINEWYDHLTISHPGIPTKIRLIRPFLCSYCSASFTKKQYLDFHESNVHLQTDT